MPKVILDQSVVDNYLASKELRAAKEAEEKQAKAEVSVVFQQYKKQLPKRNQYRNQLREVRSQMIEATAVNYQVAEKSEKVITKAHTTKETIVKKLKEVYSEVSESKARLEDLGVITRAQSQSTEHKSVGRRGSASWFSNLETIRAAFRDLNNNGKSTVMPTGEFKFTNFIDAAKKVLEDYEALGEEAMTETYLHTMFSLTNCHSNRKYVSNQSNSKSAPKLTSKSTTSTIEAKAEVVTPEESKAKMTVSQPEIKSNKGVYAVAANH